MLKNHASPKVQGQTAEKSLATALKGKHGQKLGYRGQAAHKSRGDGGFVMEPRCHGNVHGCHERAWSSTE